MRKLYVLLACLCICFTSAKAQIREEGYPVIINQDTLFTFYTGQGLFSPAERAQAVTKRINTLINRIDFNPDSLVLKNDSALSVITYQSQMVLAVNNRDAAITEFSRAQLAASYLAILKKQLGNVFQNNSIRQLITNLLEAAAVVALLILLIWGVNRAFRWLKLKIIKAWESRLAKLAAKGAPVGYANRIFPLINSLLRVLRFIIIILLVYLALPVLFFIFPSSKPYATLLLSYIVDPLKSILLAFIIIYPTCLP